MFFVPRILLTCMLQVTDVGLGHIQDQITHIRQALATIRLRGGISGFKKNLGMTALLVQFEELKKDTLLDDWPVHPTIEVRNTYGSTHGISQIVSPPVLHALPTGFYRLAKNDHLSESTCTIVLRLRHQIETDFSIPSFDSTNIEARYAGFSQACPPLGPSDCPILEKLVCLALLRHAANAFGRVRTGICPYDGLREALITKVLTVDIPKQGIERQTLLWVWLVAVDAWATGNRPSVLSHRGMEALRLLPTKFPETQNWKISDFEAHGRKFLWHNAIRLWLQPAWQSVTGALPRSPSPELPPTTSTTYLGISAWPTHPHFPLPPSFWHVIGEISNCLTAPDHDHVPITLREKPSLCCLEPALPNTSRLGRNSMALFHSYPSFSQDQSQSQSSQPA